MEKATILEFMRDGEIDERTAVEWFNHANIPLNPNFQKGYDAVVTGDDSDVMFHIEDI